MIVARRILARRCTDYLPRQRWFAGARTRHRAGPDRRQRGPASPWPGLHRGGAEARRRRRRLPAAASACARPASRPSSCGARRRPCSASSTPTQGQALAYDGLLDPELALALLRRGGPGEEKADRVRPVAAEQSNTSLVYRRPADPQGVPPAARGPNPEVEVTVALAEVGFATWPSPWPPGAGTAPTWRSCSRSWPGAPRAGPWPSPRSATCTPSPVRPGRGGRRLRGRGRTGWARVTGRAARRPGRGVRPRRRRRGTSGPTDGGAAEAGAARRHGRGRPAARRPAAGPGGRRAGHPGPRRLPPRPGDAHRRRAGSSSTSRASRRGPWRSAGGPRRP